MYASWAHRVAAAVVDLVIVIAPFIAGGLLAAAADSASSPRCSYNAWGEQRCTQDTWSYIANVLGVAGALVSLGLLLYSVYREGRTGQTFGKRVWDIRLVRETTGQPLGFGIALLRKLCHIFDALPCDLGWLWPLWDAKKQTFADKIVGSVVVHVHR